jgi:hypothetical protein
MKFKLIVILLCVMFSPALLKRRKFQTRGDDKECLAIKGKTFNLSPCYHNLDVLNEWVVNEELKKQKELGHIEEQDATSVEHHGVHHSKVEGYLTELLADDRLMSKVKAEGYEKIKNKFEEWLASLAFVYLNRQENSVVSVLLEDAFTTEDLIMYETSVLSSSYSKPSVEVVLHTNMLKRLRLLRNLQSAHNDPTKAAGITREIYKFTAEIEEMRKNNYFELKVYNTGVFQQAFSEDGSSISMVYPLSASFNESEFKKEDCKVIQGDFGRISPCVNLLIGELEKLPIIKSKVSSRLGSREDITGETSSNSIVFFNIGDEAGVITGGSGEARSSGSTERDEEEETDVGASESFKFVYFHKDTSLIRETLLNDPYNVEYSTYLDALKTTKIHTTEIMVHQQVVIIMELVRYLQGAKTETEFKELLNTLMAWKRNDYLTSLARKSSSTKLKVIRVIKSIAADLNSKMVKSHSEFETKEYFSRGGAALSILLKDVSKANWVSYPVINA